MTELADIIATIDQDLGQGRGRLRDYVKTGLIMRQKVETAANGQISYEATVEAPNDHPGTARATTLKISEAAYDELGTLGVP